MNEAGGRGPRYGYVIILAGILVYIGSNGFGRYSYSLLLPAMRDALGLSHTELGLIAGGNALAYMLFSPVCGYWSARRGARRVIVLSMLLTGASMMLIGLAGAFWLILPLRFLSGVGSAGSQTPALSLTAAWFAPKRRGLATGIMYTGLGIGLIISGLAVPRLMERWPEGGWRLCWEVLGGAVLVIGLISFAVLRDSPEKMGLRPPEGAGSGKEPAGYTRAGVMYRSPFMWRLGLSYLLFGFANLMFFTFITAALIGEKGFSPEGAGEFMALDGLLSIAGAVLWGALSDRGNRRRILAGALLLAGTAYVMFALGQGVIILVAAEVLKCLTVGGVAALTLTLAAEKSGRPLAAAGMGMITAFLGVGQTLGPPAGGFIIDQTGSYAPMLLAAAGITILAAVNMALPEASAGRSTIPKK